MSENRQTVHTFESVWASIENDRTEAISKGIGILRPKGENVEILDSHLIEY